MKTTFIIAALACVFAVSTTEAYSVKAGVACDVCLRVLGRVFTDMQNGSHDPQAVEQDIQKECKADSGLPQVWEKEACIIDLSLTIPYIEEDYSSDPAGSAQKVCSSARIC
uniref:Saposin B-type domain-containing protein n=1 Tax=Plectus sambesii TaxID=2011161 RepID=A0A914WMK7_9BILA